MKFFGEWSVHNIQGQPKLFRLHNPMGADFWGVELDDGWKVVPCDNFVHDLSSSPMCLWFIYPSIFGKTAATIHDWGTRAHKVSVDELLVELAQWFDAMGWDYVQRIGYVDRLRAISQEEWDLIYYVLTQYDGVGEKRRWAAWKVLRMFGWVNWSRPAKDWTRLYREASK